MTVLKHQNTITFQYISSLKISGLLHFLKFLGPSEKITIYRSWMMTLYVHQILKPDQMFPEHLRDNEGALPSPVCSCVRVKRKCSSLPRALNIKCAAKLSFFLPFSLNQSPFTVFNIFFSAQNIHEVILWSQQNEIKFCIFNLFHQQNFDIRKADSNFWKCKSQFSDKIVSIMYRGSAILQASHKNCFKIEKQKNWKNINTSGIAYLKCIWLKRNFVFNYWPTKRKQLLCGAYLGTWFYLDNSSEFSQWHLTRGPFAFCKNDG